jgi:hypothetical protein
LLYQLCEVMLAVHVWDSLVAKLARHLLSTRRVSCIADQAWIKRPIGS